MSYESDLSSFSVYEHPVKFQVKLPLIYMPTQCVTGASLLVTLRYSTSFIATILHTSSVETSAISMRLFDWWLRYHQNQPLPFYTSWRRKLNTSLNLNTSVCKRQTGDHRTFGRNIVKALLAIIMNIDIKRMRRNQMFTGGAEMHLVCRLLTLSQHEQDYSANEVR